MQRLEEAPHVHTPDLLDFRAADGLPVRDDREGLEGRGREAVGPHGKLGALDGLGVLGPRQQLKALAELDELDSMSVHIVRLAQLIQSGAHGRRRRLGIERREFLDGNGARAGEQRGFKQLR